MNNSAQSPSRAKAGALLKIFLSLLPAVIFVQNYAWMTANLYVGIAFVIIWAIMVWSAWQFDEKNHVLERLFRLSEIAFFLLPASAIIFTFVVGAQAVTSADSSAGQAGAAIGTAIGGTFIIAIAFILGIIGGIIMHLVASKYDKKAEASDAKQSDSIANKHGVILSLVGIIVLAFIAGAIGTASHSVEAVREKQGLQKAGAPAAAVAEKQQPDKVSLEVVKKGFIASDWSARRYEDDITFDLKFTNNTDKPIRGVSGILTFYDIFDKKIYSIDVSYDESLPALGSKVWESGIEYNQFIDEHQKLRNTDLKNLQYKWKINAIIYEDGTKEAF